MAKRLKEVGRLPFVCVQSLADMASGRYREVHTPVHQQDSPLPHRLSPKVDGRCVSLNGRCVSFTGSQALQAGPLTALGDVPRTGVWLI